jgi:hypothetical protein
MLLALIEYPHTGAQPTLKVGSLGGYYNLGGKYNFPKIKIGKCNLQTTNPKKKKGREKKEVKNLSMKIHFHARNHYETTNASFRFVF